MAKGPKKIDWNSIERTCPKAIQWLKPFAPNYRSMNIRGLYDFFDQAGLFVSIYIIPKELKRRKKFRYMVGNLGTEDTFETRRQAEVVAFTQCFVFLNWSFTEDKPLTSENISEAISQG